PTTLHKFNNEQYARYHTFIRRDPISSAAAPSPARRNRAVVRRRHSCRLVMLHPALTGGSSMRFHGSFPLRPRALAAVVAAAFLIAGAGRPARAQRYSIRDLGTLGGTFDQPLGINAAGQVVGNSNLTGDQFYHAVLFTAGPPTDLGTFSGNLSTARAINDSGQIVGFAYTTGDQNVHAFLYDGGAMKDLGAFGTIGPLNSSALAINNAGQIVGWAGLPNGAAHAFLYQNGKMQDLGTLGGAISQAVGINQAGVICGQSETRGQSSAPAFLYRDGVMT